MSGRAAEAIQQARLQPEEYAHSVINAIRWGGELAVEHAIGQEQELALREQNFDDYAAGLREMLRTDSEFSDHLDIDDKREHPVVDGRARAVNGQSMVEIVAEGRRGSEKLAADYEEWQPQAVRDGGDELIAERADALKPGQTLFAVSLNPARALKDYPELYRRLGYRDLSYIQYYSKTPDGRLVAGSYSVDKSDLATWRQLLTDKGVEVAADADENTFIRNSFEVTASPQQAEQMTRDMRADYYGRRGLDYPRHSVSEYLEHHDQVAQTFFDAYYPSLAEAAHSGDNNEVMRGFARTLVDAKIDRLKPEIRRMLIKVANSPRFDYEATKVMDSVIRYAVVEELRKGLDAYVADPQEEVPAVDSRPGNAVTIPGVNLFLMNNLLADNVSSGVEAGRDYGGCPGQVELSDTDESGTLNTGNISGLAAPQAAYGGRGRGRRTKLDDGDCEFTSKKCPECGKRNVKTTVTRVRGKKHVEGGCGCSKTYN